LRASRRCFSMTRCEALSLDEKTLMRFLVLFLLSAGILRGSSSDIAVDWLLSSKASKPVLPIYNVFCCRRCCSVVYEVPTSARQPPHCTSESRYSAEMRIWASTHISLPFFTQLMLVVSTSISDLANEPCRLACSAW
jgi:hypothetical protein